jgi:hypothetical protein
MCATFQAQKRIYELLNDDDIEGQVPGLQNVFSLSLTKMLNRPDYLTLASLFIPALCF